MTEHFCTEIWLNLSSYLSLYPRKYRVLYSAGLSFLSTVPNWLSKNGSTYYFNICGVLPVQVFRVCVNIKHQLYMNKMPPQRSVDTTKKLVSELPQVPEYVPLNPHEEERQAVGLPAELITSPLDVFHQLFTQEIWESLCQNTNAYYRYRSSNGSNDMTDPDVKPRPWKDTTVGELKVWLGLMLSMGIVSCPAIEDYWSEDTRQKPMSAMSLNRFFQIKRFLHVSPPPCISRSSASSVSTSGVSSSYGISGILSNASSTSRAPEWWEKMEPMSSIAQKRCQECYVPSSNVAIDEIMVKFEGRSVHTLRMPKKPVDHGYKVFALADSGYIYGWLYHSRVAGTSTVSERTSILKCGFCLY